LLLALSLRFQRPAPLAPTKPEYFDPDATGIPAYAITTPPVRAAADAELADDEDVLGVAVGGKPRAYRVRALGGTPWVHVVHDLLGDTPVTIAHCDRTGCSKAFTGGERGQTLKVAFGGWREGQMWVRAGRGVYAHETLEPAASAFPPFPYAETHVERTTWKK